MTVVSSVGADLANARDAYVIAETARHRRDFATFDVPAQPSWAVASALL